MNINYFKAHQPVDLDIARQLSNKTFALFDLETTGFYGDEKDQLTQIGSLCVNGNTLEQVGEAFNSKARLNEFHLNRFRQEMAKEGDDPGYQSIHWILALNNYHPLNTFTDVTLKAELNNEDDSVFYKDYQMARKLSKNELESFISDQQHLPTEEQMLADFEGWCLIHKVNFGMGHNAEQFDKKFLNDRLAAHGRKPWKIPVIDTMWLVRLLLNPAILALRDSGDQDGKYLAVKLATKKNPEKLSSRLQDLRDVMGVEGGLAHDAVGDVRTNLQVLKWVIRFLKEKSPYLTGNPLFESNKVQVFAKHKARGFKY